MTIGIHDGFLDCMNTADVLSHDTPSVEQRFKLIRGALDSNSSFGEIVKQMDRFYDDPANAVLPVVDIYIQSIRKFKGDSDSNIQTALANLRKLYYSPTK